MIKNDINEEKLEELCNFSSQCLKESKSEALMKVGIETIGDLIRTFPEKMRKFTPNVLTFFIEQLNNPNLFKSLRPAIFSAIGDIAISSPREIKDELGRVFDLYLMAFDAVLHFFNNGVRVVNQGDESVMEFAHNLKEAVIWSLGCLNHGLLCDPSVADEEVYKRLLKLIPGLNLFIAKIIEDKHNPSDVEKIDLESI